MQSFNVLPHHILVAQHLSAIRTRIGAHHAVVREHVLLPRVTVCKGLRADFAHMVFGRPEVEALLMALERLHRREDLLAADSGGVDKIITATEIYPALTLLTLCPLSGQQLNF